VITTDDGSPSLHHAGFGQACHSTAGAWREARETYAIGARLRERALAGEMRECRLLDVATGLGWNLAAGLEALDGTGCSLHAVALESDVRILARAVGLARLGRGAGANPWWELVADALERALARPSATTSIAFAGARGSLRLLLGDARATLAHLADSEPGSRFDAVFLDPFSPAADPTLWEWPFLNRISECMAPRALLVTYCAASRVRLGLARAGLRVGRGPGLGAKAEGTVASHERDLPALPARAAANLARALAGQDSIDPPS